MFIPVSYNADLLIDVNEVFVLSLTAFIGGSSFVGRTFAVSANDLNIGVSVLEGPVGEACTGFIDVGSLLIKVGDRFRLSTIGSTPFGVEGEAKNGSAFRARAMDTKRCRLLWCSDGPTLVDISRRKFPMQEYLFKAHRVSSTKQENEIFDRILSSTCV